MPSFLSLQSKSYIDFNTTLVNNKYTIDYDKYINGVEDDEYSVLSTDSFKKIKLNEITPLSSRDSSPLSSPRNSVDSSDDSTVKSRDLRISIDSNFPLENLSIPLKEDCVIEHDDDKIIDKKNQTVGISDLIGKIIVAIRNTYNKEKNFFKGYNDETKHTYHFIISELLKKTREDDDVCSNTESESHTQIFPKRMGYINDYDVIQKRKDLYRGKKYGGLYILTDYLNAEDKSSNENEIRKYTKGFLSEVDAFYFHLLSEYNDRDFLLHDLRKEIESFRYNEYLLLDRNNYFDLCDAIGLITYGNIRNIFNTRRSGGKRKTTKKRKPTKKRKTIKKRKNKHRSTRRRKQ